MNKNSTLFFPEIWGNEPLKRHIGTDIQNGSLFHSILLSGPPGCGKRSFARQIAAALACEGNSAEEAVLPCGACLPCRKILSGNSTDVITVDRDKHETLGVSSVRDFRSDALMTTNDMDFKVYIINDVHTMTVQAQNAALKILEEPPKNVFFLLLCESTQNLLETILSRVMLFHMDPLSDELLEKLILSRIPTASAGGEEASREFREILKYARGSFGRAAAILQEKEAKRAERLSEYRLPSKLLDALAFRVNRAEYLALTQQIPDDRNQLSALFTGTALAARDLIALKQNRSLEPLYYLSGDDAAHAASAISCERAYRIALLAQNAQDALAKNINLQLVKNRFIFELRAAFGS